MDPAQIEWIKCKEDSKLVPYYGFLLQMKRDLPKAKANRNDLVFKGANLLALHREYYAELCQHYKLLQDKTNTFLWSGGGKTELFSSYTKLREELEIEIAAEAEWLAQI